MNAAEDLMLPVQSRRQFVGHLVKGAAVAAIATEGLMLGGCNLYNDILNWVPVGEAALNSIMSVLTSNGIIISPEMQVIVALVEAGFNALTAAIKEYEATTPPPVGAVAKIQTAFTDIVDNFSTFLKSLNVSGGLVSIVVGLASVIFSTIAAFANQLPAVTPKFRTAVQEIRVAKTIQAVTPKPRTKRAFKKDFNSVLDAGVKIGVMIPKSAYLPLSMWEHL